MKSLKTPRSIRRVSNKQAKRLREYNKIRDKFMEENPVCMFPDCEREATDLHHSRGRIGDNLLDPSTFKSLCREHHHYIEVNPDVAKELGLSQSRLGI